MTLRTSLAPGRTWLLVSISLVGCILAAVLASSQPAAAQTRRFSNQEASLAAVYGRGVHAYFGGQLSEADQLLTQAIEAGSRDPRAFYFRGMTRLAMGRRYEAEQDIRVGAALEADKPAMRRAISQSLIRVQGTKRKWLEGLRRNAQLDVVRNQQQESQRRYGNQPSRNQQRVLRRPIEVPIDQLGTQAPQIVRPQPSPSTSPEPATAPTPAPVPAAEPAAPTKAVAPATPPIEATPQPTLAAPATPPFPDPAETPATEPAGPQSPNDPAAPTLAPPVAEQLESDPFGDAEEIAVEDPAATPEPAPEPTPPAAEPEPPASDDPFDFGLEDEPPVDQMPPESDEAAETADLVEEPAVPTPEAEQVEPEAAPVDSPATPEPAAEEDPFGLSDATQPPTEQPSAEADPFATPSEAPPAAEKAEDSPEAGETPVEELEQPAGETPAATDANPRKFLGVLGRIVGAATPDLPRAQMPTLPSMGPPPGEAPDEGAFDFGPGANGEFGEADFGEFEQIPDGAAETPEQMPAEEPAVADPTDAPTESDDPFDAGEDPFGAADDPFGGFTEEPAEDAAEQDNDQAEQAPEEVEPAEETEEAESDAADSEEAESESEEADSSESESSEEDDPFGGFGEF